ncbi:hypothetical protein ACFO0N_04485 [Halobium salinum]|uniref:Uncharacterized protein n=1 Tax=Halobium salinum TaxID=1364940 RepID=A0ABD5P904_9EURY|nr:hypothetical protein [Halobium salinum]
MEPALRRRLDALILLCSALLGTVLAYTLLSSRAGPGFLVLALLPSAVVATAVFWFVNQSPAPLTGSQD